jgi:hypothetical protein
MAQNVGPILEMVTEKYLLRSPDEWTARQNALTVFDDILDTLRAGDIARLGALTTHNFFGPLQTIVPWASNLYTETLIQETRRAFGDDFWGFWMLGGMSGGGMGFIFDPKRKAEAQDKLQAIMSGARRRFEHALPFAMEPVVYDFAINEQGTVAQLRPGDEAPLPPAYYAHTAPALLRRDPRALPPGRRAELSALANAARTRPELCDLAQTFFDRLLPQDDAHTGSGALRHDLWALLHANGFDPVQHEQIRDDLRHGRIGWPRTGCPSAATSATWSAATCSTA